jgi:hypothetical protein
LFTIDRKEVPNMQPLFKPMKKKGMTIGDLGPVALVLGVSILIVAITASIVSTMQGDLTPDSTAYNVTASGLEALDVVGSNIPTIGLVVASAIIIGVLVVSFRTK